MTTLIARAPHPLDENSGPVEVWLSQPNMAIDCRVVYDDETAISLPVDSLSMRGAQREMTAELIFHGYKPVGRWETETFDDHEGIDRETVRRFAKREAKPAKDYRPSKESEGGSNSPR